MAELDSKKGARPRPPTVPAARARRSRPSTATTQKAISNHLQDVHSRVVASVLSSLTASAELMDAGDTNDFQPNAVTRTWQHACWGYVHSVPELNAAKMYVGNALARCSLAVGKRNPDGSVEQGFDGDEPAEGLSGEVAEQAADLISKIRSKVGGQSEVLRSYGEKQFVAGESYMLPLDTPAGLAFEVLSTQEISKEGNKYVRHYGPGGKNEDLPDGVVPLRVWRPDSQFGQLADSSVRSCMEILEELVVLTRLVRSAAISRIALAGILAIADDFDTPDEEAGADGQNDEATNPLAVDIINTGSKAIDDPASAAAWMPYILQGDINAIDKGLKLITFHTDDAEHVVKRREAVERLAQGLDMPVEVVLGHQSTTYANAAQISEDTFKLHIEPTLQLLCDALTIGYLWPAMAKSRGIDAEHLKDAPYPDDILTVAVTYDATKLISRPDRAKDIIMVATKDQTQTMIRISEVRTALGLDPEQAPDDKEVARRIDAYRLAHIREMIAAPPGDAAVPIEEADKAVVPGQSAGSQLIGQQAETAETQASVEADAAITAAAVLGYKIAAAVELTIERSCEKVGAKLKSRIAGMPSYDTIRQAVQDVPNLSVARVLGPEVATRILGKDDPSAVEITALQRAVTRWAAEAGFADAEMIGLRAADFTAVKARLRLFGDALVIPPEETDALVALER